MNTVDALNVLGKALCGDSFEVKPGLTDAETILEIAKNYEGGSGSGSGGSGGGSSPMIVAITHEENPRDPSIFDDYLESTWQEIADGYLAGRTVLCERVSNDELNGDMTYHATIVSVSSSGVGSDYPLYTVVTVGPDFDGNPTILFTTTDPNGRPKYSVN